MKKSVNVFVATVVSVLAVMFLFLNIVPIIGPSFAAYKFSNLTYEYRAQGLAKFHIVLSAAIGELVFFAIASWVILRSVKFENPELFWTIVIADFALTYALSVVFSFIGYRKAKKRVILARRY
ncbi:MAG: hypothetical protein WCX77_04160 [Candidatus Paceibacterota bacterium]|jgi:hypothetical protein